MTLSIRPFAGGFGAEVFGIDLRIPPSPSEQAGIEAALARHAVLGFRNQPLNDDEQVAFSGGFGRVHESILDASRRRFADRRFNDVGNVGLDGDVKKAGAADYADANLLWHADLSFLPIPARVTVLSARVLPSSPPDTQFADMRAAWDALAPPRQAELEGLMVEHSLLHARAKTGFTSFTDEERARIVVVRHPLVRTHARSGRKSLYLSSSASHIVGWPEHEGRALIDALMAHATQIRFVLSYRWQDNDVLVWDDSCTVHRATPFASAQRRELHWNAVVEPMA